MLSSNKKTNQTRRNAISASHKDKGLTNLPKFKNNGDQIVHDTGEGLAECDSLLINVAGTADSDLTCYLVGQAADAIQRTKKPQADILNKAVAALAGIGPRDELEGMLATQMLAVHHLAMESMKRARQQNQSVEVATHHINRATKLLRTFTAQVETLNRYRGKGQQKVTVEHVHINKGGQAIVGAVNQTGGGGDGNS